MYCVATGRAKSRLEAQNLAPPVERGAISGPTGALLYDVSRQSVDSPGLIVEASPKFPDPTAAKTLLEAGIEPIADIEVETSSLLERAEEIRKVRKQLARQMQQASEESSRADPVGMFQ